MVRRAPRTRLPVALPLVLLPLACALAVGAFVLQADPGPTSPAPVLDRSALATIDTASDPTAAAMPETAGRLGAAAGTLEPSEPVAFACGSIAVELRDARGTAIPLGAHDRLLLRCGLRGRTVVAPDESGHLVAHNVPVGCHAVTLSSWVAGPLTIATLIVHPEETETATFSYDGPSLARRVAVRVEADPACEPALPAATDVRLHGLPDAIRTAQRLADDLFVFDDVPPGLYDVEVRRGDASAQWLRNVEPGAEGGESFVGIDRPHEPRPAPPNSTR